MTCRFGLLIKTLHFEVKLGYFTSLCNNNKNRMNLFQAMVKRHQFKSFLYRAQDNFLYLKKYINKLKKKHFESQEVPVEFFEGHIKAVI